MNVQQVRMSVHLQMAAYEKQKQLELETRKRMEEEEASQQRETEEKEEVEEEEEEREVEEEEEELGEVGMDDEEHIYEEPAEARRLVYMCCYVM